MRLLGGLLFMSLPALAMCPSEAECRNGARGAFLDVESVARLPDGAQKEQIARLYRETYVQLQEYLAHLRPYRVPPGEGLSVEDLAARLELDGGWGALAEEARRRCRLLFGRHREAVQLLVQADFREGGNESLRRALLVVSSLRMTEFFSETLEVFRSAAPSLVDAAAYALRDLGDPRAIEPLVSKHPSHPTVYFELLRHLQRSRAPHPMLVKLLEDRNAEIRWQAAYALAEAAHQPQGQPK